MPLNTAEAAISAALAEIQREPEKKEAWRRLFLLLSGNGLVDPALALVAQRQQRFSDALSFCYDLWAELAVKERKDLLTPLLERIGQGHLLLPIALFVRGILAAAAEDPEQAGPLFQAAVSAVPAIKSVAQHDREFVARCYVHMVNLATQVETPAFLAGLGDDDPAPAVQHDPREIPPAEFVVLAACDARYFAEFAPRLAESVAERAGDRAILHLNVVDPDETAEAMIPALQDRHPRLLVSRQQGQVVGRPSAYYACNRFLVAPALLDRYQRPLVIADVDVAFRRDPGDLLHYLDRHDFALFEWADPIPSLRCFCMLSIAGDTAEARRFLATTGRYAKRKLAEGALWLTDQASLWTVSRSLGRTLHGPRWGNLTALTGTSFESFVLSNEAKIDKFALRRRNDEGAA